METLSVYQFWDLWTATFGVLWLIRWGLLIRLLVDTGWGHASARRVAIAGIIVTIIVPFIPVVIGIGNLFTQSSRELAQPIPGGALITLIFLYGIMLAALLYNQLSWWPNWALSYRGLVLLVEQRYLDALVMYQNLARRAPHMPTSWINLTTAHYLLGHMPEAFAASEQAITRTWWRGLWRTNRWRALGLMMRARILFTLKQPGPALDANSRALQLHPRNSVVWERESVYLAQLERYLEALDASGRALNLIPPRARNPKQPAFGLALVAQAEALNGLYRSGESLAIADQAAQVSQYPVRAHLARAIALTQMGRHEEARAAAEQGLSAANTFFTAVHNVPGRAEMLGYQAYLLRLAGRPQEADATQTQSAALYTQMATPASNP